MFVFLNVPPNTYLVVQSWMGSQCIAKDEEYLPDNCIMMTWLSVSSESVISQKMEQVPIKTKALSNCINKQISRLMCLVNSKNIFNLRLICCHNRFVSHQYKNRLNNKWKHKWAIRHRHIKSSLLMSITRPVNIAQNFSY